MRNDLKYAVRMLLKSPGFSIAALAALTLGIGATTAIFTAVNAVLLRPLPYPQADRLFLVRETRPIAGFERTVVSEGEFLRWMRDHPLIEHATVVTNPGLAIRFGDRPERVSVLQVAADFFPLFGVTPVAGRAFGREAEQPGRGDVMLITFAAWQKRFGGAADVVGRVIPVEGRATTIVGILPRRFTFGGPFEAIMPMTLGPEEAARFGDHSLDVYARLAPGIAAETAAADLTRRVLATPESVTHATGAVLLPLQEQIVGGARAPMLLLFGAVGLVLLIACANIANLLLARAASRQKEMAVRAALGATRGRVLRQLVTESLLLSGIGGVLGSLVALWLSDVLARIAGDTVPRAVEIGMDGRALGFAVVMAGLCGLLFGVAPAWQASRPDAGGALKQETRGGTAAGRRRLLAAFAVSEIALALVLLVGAGLLLTTFRNLRRVEAGFDPSRVVTAPAYLPDSKYPSGESQRAFFRRAIGDLAALPGVAAAAAVNVLPLSGNNSSGAMTPEGWRPAAPNQRESADRRAITAGYFTAMGIRLLQGRAFTDRDDERAARVAIVSRALAERYWPGESAIGKRLKLARFAADAPWLTIVGVATDVHHATLAEPSRQVVYYPHAQVPESGMVLVVRSAGAAGSIAGAIRGVMQRIDPELPLDAIEPMTDVVGASLANQRLEFALLGAFALLAVTLAAAGIYGVMAYGIVQRTQEFGIRLALGASNGDIVRLIAHQGLSLTGAGIAIGLGGAWLASSAISKQLYGVRATDPAIYGATAALLAAIALAACVAPARRALRVNPITALRE